MPLNKIGYQSGISEVPLLSSTIGDMFDQIVEKYPDNTALVVYHQDIRFTYAELHEKVNQCAKSLLAMGIKSRDRVGMWSPNCVEWVVLQYATSKIGAILVNINPAYRLNELEYAVKQSGCRLLFIGAKFKSSDYVQMIYELFPELLENDNSPFSQAKLPDLFNIIHFEDGPQPALMDWVTFNSQGKGIDDELLNKRQSEQQFNDPINIQYTSGTTGTPKGATLSHHNILNNAYFCGARMKITDQDRVVVPVPMYHCFGMVLGSLCTMSHGCTMIFPSPVFDPESALKAVENEKATALYGVPTMFIKMLEHPKFSRFEIGSLRTGMIGGANCPVQLMDDIVKKMNMREVEVIYGMTETSPISMQSQVDTPQDKRVTTVGVIHPHTEIKIIDPETNRMVAIGERGEFCTRGYSVMLYYWNDEETTREAIDSENWMHTGDLAVMDEEGYVRIVGRKKDMIIRGGENIYPREIEEILYKHPAISEVQVVGIPDEKFGEEIVAWVQLKEDSDDNIDEVSLVEYCQEKLAYFKVPKHFKFVASFPMTVTGKIKKYVLREESTKEYCQ